MMCFAMILIMVILGEGAFLTFSNNIYICKRISIYLYIRGLDPVV